MKNRMQKLSVIAVAALAMGSTAFAQNGEATYKAKCQMCHGATGLGDTPTGKAMKANPFNSPDVAKMSEADLTAITKNGKAKMPAYAGKLTDPQIKEVVEYVQTLQKKK